MTAPLSSRERAVRLLALRVAKDWIAAEERHLREDTAAELMVGERVPGALDPADPDTLLGFVQLTKGRESVAVTDRDAFTEWVAEHAPGELVTVTREDVRSSFVKAVTDSVKAHGGWITPDGELLSVDGVEKTVGAPTLTVKPTAEADALVAEALASRRLSLSPGPSTGIVADSPEPPVEATSEREAAPVPETPQQPASDGQEPMRPEVAEPGGGS